LGVSPDQLLTKKHFKMALKFGKYERQDRVELGTVHSLVGKGGKIALIPKNLADEDKRVAVILTKKSGDSAMILCSEAVSKGVRAKEITVSNLLGFVVTEQLTTKGETIYVITMPNSGGQLIEQSVDSLKITEFEPTAIELDDLVAF